MTELSISLAVDCGCVGSEHKTSSCPLTTRLPLPLMSIPGRCLIELGTISKVEEPESIYRLRLPVSYQFDIMVLSPAYNKVDDYGESLSYCHTALPHSTTQFINQFLEKVTAIYGQPFNYHKNPKLLIADNAHSLKAAFHCEPFSVKVGGICITHTSRDLSVESMNRRKFVWSYTLTAVDGAALNLESWRKNTSYYRAKQALRSFLWIAVILVFLVPVTVHNMNDHDANCLLKCCDPPINCEVAKKYWGHIMDTGPPVNISDIMKPFEDNFSLANFGKMKQ